MRSTFGLLIWLIGLGVLGYFVWPSTDEGKQTQSQLVQYLTKPRQDFNIEFESRAVLRVGDPIVVFEDGNATVVGNVTGIGPQEDPKINIAYTETATVQFYSSTPSIAVGDYLGYHQTPSSMDWVVQMMLPPHKRQEIRHLIVDAYQEHQSEILELLQPIVLQSIKDASEVIREDFHQSIIERQDQIAKLGDRYQVELVERELVPLIKDEIWPIVQAEMTPLASEIGEEIWQRASVWRFGWRYLYDQSPLPERNLTRKEFERFMQRQGTPVIEAYVPEILESQQRVLRRTSENEKVRTVVSDTTMRVLRDPEFQRLTMDLLQDVFVDNQRLTQVFEKNWKSEEAKRALEITNKRLDPTITRIGQALFGSPELSITPEFSRVLRNRILHKDDRWLVLRLAEDRSRELGVRETMRVMFEETGTENPFHVPARK